MLALASAALGWRDRDADVALFRWKHHDNPFGRSAMWVATSDGRLAGFRSLLRWRWRTPLGETLNAVRAVDTATHPDFQGQGVFTALTRHALHDLAAGGATDFVFNTPNDQSRPGYLKMGWQEVGRVPVAVTPRGPRAALRMRTARVPAQKWSLDTTCGDPAADALADTAGLEALLSRIRRPTGLRTDLSPEFLRWRYAGGPMRYRVILRTRRLEDGLVVFRLRGRGPAVEATVCAVLLPAGDRWGAHVLLDRVRRATRADYLIRVGHGWLGPGWGVELPGLGPTLTWRGVGEGGCPPPALRDWDLSLGDIELF